MLEPVGQECVFGHFFVTLGSNYLGLGRTGHFFKVSNQLPNLLGLALEPPPNQSIS